ncbi:MAG: DUF4105 domain-containing protein [Saprospiraceae bacterium]|nr:DUF4105 domain-containing protein [Saprospiraceae bacterium]
MLNRLLLVLLCCQAPGLRAQTSFPLSDSARISLMTVAPGEFVYSTFGHSALRVHDPLQRFDRVYNYGTFNFEQPNFLLKFCQGRLLYYLDVETYRSFEYGNLYDRRPMREQILNLRPDSRQRLFDLLQENAREENRYYKYEFFYDNCATRIRDIVKETFFHQITFDSSGLPPGKTMRQLLHQYLTDKPWTEFGIDLVLGTPADRLARAEDYMFLPDYVHDMFADAAIDDSTRLVRSERRIPERLLPDTASAAPGFWGSPFLVMCLVALLGLLCMANPRTEYLFDLVFWFVLGLAGLVMVLLWAATDHTATKTNWNLLWALPTHLLYFWRRTRSEWVENYFLGAGILAALTLLFWAFLPQALPLAAVPIAALVVVKAIWRRYWKKDTIEAEIEQSGVA